MTSRRVQWLACALGLASVGANCEQCQPVPNPRKGNLDRAADAVIVHGADGHAYAVVSNPELQHLRVFDLTTEAFVFAPNRYFPLSVDVGPDTRRLAVDDADPTRVFALDGAADEIFVVRADEGFARSGDPLPTGRAPADLAVVGSELWVTLPEESAVQILDLGGAQLARIDLDELDGVPARPGDIVIDPQDESVVVADAALPLVHVIARATKELARSLDVGGPTASLSAGVIDIGDGLAPVVLAVRSDAPIVVAIKLFRAVPEDRYAVLGSVEVPGIPLISYVPDHRTSATICCREFSDAAVAAGEATDAWGAVASADGKVTYLSLRSGAVRIFDNDLEGPATGEPLPDAWAPVAGDEDREPAASFAAGSDFGDPPFAPLIDGDERLRLTWQGSLPGLAGVRGTWTGGDSAFVADAADLAARGARAGDLAIIAIEDAGAACDDDDVTGIIDVVEGAVVTIALDEPAEEVCLVGGGVLRVSVAPADAFVVTDRDSTFLGRLAFVGPDAALPFAGGLLTVTPSAVGPPTRRGSALLVPLNPHLALIDLDLSDPPSFLASDRGGFGQGALLPVALVGGKMTIPGVELGTEVRARRMLMATASDDRFGLNTIFVCDEAETVPGLCKEFR
jgi:urease accessory protein UreE